MSQGIWERDTGEKSEKKMRSSAFNKPLLTTYSVSGPVLGPGDTAPDGRGSIVLVGRGKHRNAN